MRFQWQSVTMLPIAITIAMAVSGCSQTDYTPNTAVTPPPAAPATLVVVHASPDSPNLNIDVRDSSGESQGAAPILDVGFGGATAAFQLPLGTYTINVDELLPTGDGSTTATNSLLSPVSTDLSVANAQTVVFVAGPNASVSAFRITVTSGASGSANVVVANLAQAAGPYSVYVTSPTATIADSTPVGSGLGLNAQTSATLLPAGSTPYRVRVVNSSQVVVFDSGTSTALTLPSGGAVVLALLDNVQPGASPFMLGEYSASLAQTFVDSQSTSIAKFANAAPDVGALDAAANGTAPLASNIAPGASAYVCAAAAGNPTIDFYPTGTTNPIPELETGAAFLASNFSFIPTGLGTSGAADNTLSTIVSSNDDRARATEARLKFINASPSATFGDGTTTAVNLYVSPAGTVTDGTITAGSVTPSAYVEDLDAGDGSIIPAAVPFGSEASFPDANYLSDADPEPTDGFLYLQPYLELPAGSYDIRITTTDAGGVSQTIVGEQDGVSLAAGGVVSVIASDLGPRLMTLDNAHCP